MGIEGLIAAPFTPFDESGHLKLEAVPRQVEHLIENRVAGAFIAGSTGEFPSLRAEERMRLCEAWRAETEGKPIKLIVHVGSCCQTESIELARHAQRAGVDAVAALAPYYFKPQSVADLLSFLDPVIEACRPLPFYYYHIPALTGVDLSVTELLSAVDQRYANFAGVKYTDSNLAQLQQCLQRFPDRFDMLFGRDEMLLAALSLGVRGAVGSTYNFAARLYHELIAAFDGGDLATARRLQAEAVEMIDNLAELGFMGAAKSLMQELGVDCGPPRPPLPPVSKKSG